MAPAQRHGELIADLAAERAVLREAQMVSICGLPAANQAGLFGNELDVLRSRKRRGSGTGKPALIDRLGERSIVAALRLSMRRRGRLLGSAAWGYRLSPAPVSRVANWPGTHPRPPSISLGQSVLGGRIRCAQMAASSAEPKSLSSARSRSRNSADASGPRIGLAEGAYDLSAPRREFVERDSVGRRSADDSCLPLASQALASVWSASQVGRIKIVLAGDADRA